MDNATGVSVEGTFLSCRMGLLSQSLLPPTSMSSFPLQRLVAIDCEKVSRVSSALTRTEYAEKRVKAHSVLGLA